MVEINKVDLLGAYIAARFHAEKFQKGSNVQYIAICTAIAYAESQAVRECHWIEFCKELTRIDRDHDLLGVYRHDGGVFWELTTNDECASAADPEKDQGKDYDSLFRRLGLKA